MTLQERIEAACRADGWSADVSQAEARRWFAARLHVSMRTVQRWCEGSRRFEGPALACREMMERGTVWSAR